MPARDGGGPLQQRRLLFNRVYSPTSPTSPTPPTPPTILSASVDRSVGNVQWASDGRSVFVQYDTESEGLSWQSRLHWIVKPGQNLYLVGLFGWDRFERDSFAREGEELTVKVSYTWRF